MSVLTVDEGTLTRELSARLGRGIRLTALSGMKPSGIAFRGDAVSGDWKCFVKVTPKGGCLRSVEAYRACADLPFVPNLLIPDVLSISGWDVLCLEFLPGETLARLEDLSNRGFESIIQSYRLFSAALARATDRVPAHPGELSDRLLKILRDVARRNRLWKVALSPVLSIPAEDGRTHGRKLDLIHNDFSSGNIAFCGSELAAVYDFENVDFGIACEDIVRLLATRYFSRNVSRTGRRRLREFLARAIESLPYASADWHVAFRIFQLKTAVVDVLASPRFRTLFKMAQKLRRQDRLLRELEEAVP